MAIITAPAPLRCETCYRAMPINPKGCCAAGYGIDNAGQAHCYSCCANEERERMIETGRATLYLVRNGAGRHEVTDWAGALRFHAHAWRFRHPFAREAWIAEFRGPDGATWSAKNIGDSQIAHCRRLKRRA